MSAASLSLWWTQVPRISMVLQTSLKCDLTELTGSSLLNFHAKFLQFPWSIADRQMTLKHNASCQQWLKKCLHLNVLHVFFLNCSALSSLQNTHTTSRSLHIYGLSASWAMMYEITLLTAPLQRQVRDACFTSLVNDLPFYPTWCISSTSLSTRSGVYVCV